MAFREFRYYIGEAMKSIWYNKIMTLAALVTVTGCLLLFGVFLLFSININYISNQVMAQCEIQAFIDKEMDIDSLNAVKSSIEGIENVATVTLETQDEAYENCVKMLGDRAIGLDEHFLRPSCIITLEDLNAAPAVVKSVEKISGVEAVANRQDVLDKILYSAKIIKISGLSSMLLLAIIAIFIISNTIKLAVHAREKEIHIMKYVGATDWFIRWPFVIEGIIIGLLGGIVALLVSVVGYKSILSMLAGFDVFKLKLVSELSIPLTLSLILFGAIMGSIGSLISVRRHLQV